jgi:hypothetical protein
MSKVRVLLADDHEGILACVRIVLDEEFEVVGAEEMAVMQLRRFSALIPTCW